MLQAKNITIKYGAKTVLENVSLDFAEGLSQRSSGETVVENRPCSKPCRAVYSL